MRIRSRTIGSGLAVAAAWCLMVTGINAQTYSGGAAYGAGLAGSPHDFTLENGGANAVDVGLCTFCHTPHKAIETRLLWNHTLSANTFTWDETTTVGGTPYPTIATTWKGPSKYCLSCHDGTVAIGDVAWFDEEAPSAPINTTTHSGGEPHQIATATGSLAGNHVVAFPFPFGNVPSTYNGVTTGAAAVPTPSEWVADPTAVGIRLFVDTGGVVTAGTSSGSTGMECSSCHDPHNGPTAIGDFLLRGEATGNTNYICTKCHLK